VNDVGIEAPVAPVVAIMVTRRCNMTCAHCSVESGPRIKSQPSGDEMTEMVREAAGAGVRAVILTGGEPMLRQDMVLRLLSVAKKCGIAASVTTNGFWGHSLPNARTALSALRKAGLTFFTLSYDRYHAKFQGPDHARNITRAAEELGIPMNVTITRVVDDSELGELIEPFRNSMHPRLRFYDVQPVGRATDFPSESLRGEIEGACQGAAIPAITDDGRLTACNGPSYFQRATSPLNVGSLDDSSLTDLLHKHRDDPILDTIRTFGPARLKKELSQISGFEQFAWKSAYSGICDLCLHINSDVAAVSALRERLSRPEFVAERSSTKLVIEGVRKRGETGRDHSIGVAAARLWLSGARGASETHKAQWAQTGEKIFGRVDFDWRQMADYISACGLSSVVLPSVLHPAVARWAPRIFTERVEADALRQARRELVQRTALRVLDAELGDLGGRAVLLKGAALMARDLSAADSSEEQRTGTRRLPRRGLGDIDILVADGAADQLRMRLLERGWSGERDAPRTGPHHLAPVHLHGLPVEIHTRIMPSFWRLPETEMLKRSQPLQDFQNLSTLDAEGMIVHTLMHCSAHLFGCGLKAAWDVAWLIERTPELDVDRIRAWADRCAMPAGFYLPAKVIHRSLDVPIPSKLLDNVPTERRYVALERFVRHRLFLAMEGAYEMNPFTTHGVFLMLHNNWRGRARHVASLLAPHERESRAAAHASASTRPLSVQLRESAYHWKRYRIFAVRDREMVNREHAARLFAD